MMETGKEKEKKSAVAPAEIENEIDRTAGR